MRYPNSTEPTRYEIVLKHSDGRSWLVSYAAGSPSRRQLRIIVAERGAAIAACLGPEGQRQTGNWHTKPRPCWIGGEWWVGYTGRTQRDAISENSELPFVGTVTA